MLDPVQSRLSSKTHEPTVESQTHLDACGYQDQECGDSSNGYYRSSACSMIDVYNLYKDISGYFGQFGFFYKGNESLFCTEVIQHIQLHPKPVLRTPGGSTRSTSMTVPDEGWGRMS